MANSNELARTRRTETLLSRMGSDGGGRRCTVSPPGPYITTVSRQQPRTNLFVGPRRECDSMSDVEGSPPPSARLRLQCDPDSYRTAGDSGGPVRTAGAQRGALSCQLPTSTHLSSSQPTEFPAKLKTSRTMGDSADRGRDDRIEVLKGEASGGITATPLSRTRAAIRQAIRDLHKQIERKEGALSAGGGVRSEDQQWSPAGDRGAEVLSSEIQKSRSVPHSHIGSGKINVPKFVVGSQSLPATIPTNWRDEESWQRLDDDIYLRRPDQTRACSPARCADRPSDVEQAETFGASGGRVYRARSSASAVGSLEQTQAGQLSGTVQRVPSQLVRQQRQLGAPRHGEIRVQPGIEELRTKRSNRGCSSPSANQEARGVTKADVCRCHGTLEHQIFRRSTTPEYSEGDRCRPPTSPAAPVVQRGRDDDPVPQDQTAKRRQRDGFGDEFEHRTHRRQPKQSSSARSVRESVRGRGRRRQRSSSHEEHRPDQEQEHDRKTREPTTMRKDAQRGQPSSGGDSSHHDSDRDEDRKSKNGGGRGDRRRRKRSSGRSSSTDYSRSHSRRRSPASQRRWLKPEKFDGRSSFETFMYMFENCATYNKWNVKDKAAHLRWSLTGLAAQLLWDTDNLNYGELVDKLRSRFGGKDMEERFQTELRCRRRSKGESLRELAQDVRRLMSLAYPGQKSSLADHIARDAFLVALDDPEFELKIREREPTDLDTAVKIAQRFEVSRGIVDASSNTRHRMTRQVVEGDMTNSSNTADLEARMVALERQVQSTSIATQGNGDRGASERVNEGRARDQDAKRNKTRQNRAVNREEQSWKDELLRKIQELEAAQSAGQERVSKLVAENETLNKEVNRLSEQVRSDAVTSMEQPTVYQAAQRVGTYPSSFSRPTGVCWTCGAPGHFARECNRAQRDVRRQQASQTNTQSQPGASSSYFVAGSVTGSNGAKNRATYLRACVAGQEQDCLLDTGSEVSLLPTSMVQSELIQPTKQTLRAANGTEIAVLGKATVPFNTRFFSSTVTGLVSDHIAEVMLGVDWMADNDAAWDFRSARIRLGSRYHNLVQRRGERTWCRRVVLQEDVEIPARSQVDVPGRVVFRGRPSFETDLLWETKPVSITKGVHVARTLLPADKFTDLPVRVMNVQCQPLVVTSGTVISDMEPVAIVEPGSRSDASPAWPELTIPKTTQDRNTAEEVPEFIKDLVDSVDDATPEGAVIALKELLTRHRKVFSESEYDLGLTDVAVHHIDTGSAKPVRQPLRRYPPAHVEAISNHVDNMLSQGIVEPTSSPWASNVVLVRKKDGTYRCCIDYRQLNLVTRRDAYPLPRIDSCLDAMAEARWFSTFDLRSSYHQVRVAEEDMDKTAFICPRGMYKYRTMPFGLCNAGATFQRLMDVVLSGLHLDICLVYLDDIVVYSRTVKEHLERLETVLVRLGGAGLKLKPEKCRFFQRSVSFLGHTISDEGIGTDPDKIKAIVEWPTPTSLREVRAFVGLASYYRRYVKNFASVAAPMHALMKKNQRFHWGEEEQQSFERLKAVLTSPPILAMPSDEGEFILDTDASDTGIGAVLSQCQSGVERVVAYASRSLDRREQNYCVTRKELLAVVHFIKYFKQYLLGRTFKVRTDHAALTWLRRTPDPVGQQARWLEQMEEYDFTVEHRSGTKHSNADAMSRRPCTKKECLCRESTAAAFGGPADRPLPEERVAAVVQLRRRRDGENATEGLGVIVGGEDGEQSVERSVDKKSMEPPQTEPSSEVVLPWSLEGLQAAQRSDATIGFVIQLMESTTEQPDWGTVSLKSADVKTLWRLWPRLAIRDGLLKRRFESADGRTERWQIVWPKALLHEFLRIAHTGMTGGHLGLKKTLAAVQSRAYWPTWSSDVTAFMKRCADCARYHRGTLPRQAEMQTPLVGEPWERISVDITGPHPRSSHGKQFILTVVDHFSKWAEAIALPNHTAPTVARALMVNVFSRYGVPLQLLTDRGSEFESELFTHLMKWLEIDKLRTTAYKASTNGIVERFHRTLNSMLGKVVSESQKDWDERLPLVVAAYRASPHSSTGFSPNRLFLGRENRMPLDLVMGLPPEEINGDITVDDFVARQQEIAEAAYEVAREQLRVAAQRRKVAYDVRVKRSEYCVGDWVWYYYPRRYPRKSPKWQRCFVGPYLVIRTIPPVNYVIQKSKKSAPFVVHTDKLKKCFSPSSASWIDSEVNDDVPTGQTPTTDGRDRDDARVNGRPVQRLPEHPPVVQNSESNGSEVPGESTVHPVAPRRERRVPAKLRDYIY